MNVVQYGRNKEVRMRFLRGLLYTLAWLVLPFYGSVRGANLAGLLPAFVFMWAIGIFLAGYYDKEAFSKSKRLLAIVILCLCDQAAKLVVHFSLTGAKVLVPGAMAIEELKNVHNSAITSYLGLTVPAWGMAIVKIAGLALLYYVLTESFRESGEDANSSIGTILLFGGGAASVLDTVFWGYTLDWFRLDGFFTMDLKDLWITLAIGAFVLYFWKHRKSSQSA